MREGLTFGKPYAFRNTTLSPASSFSQPQSLLSQSFGQLYGLSTAGELPKKRKSVDAGGSPSKRSRSNSQSPDKAKREKEVNSQTTSLYTHDDSLFDNRIFRCLVISPAGRAIREFRSIPELLEALRDAIKAHRSLYINGKILHRDISENNIIITDPKEADGFTGMLIDEDLAKEIGSGRSGARHQTGTMEFMAIEVLRRVSHTYRHDLE
jgi:5-carboxymethyl-2-hydroxymuconate isomerase